MCSWQLSNILTPLRIVSFDRLSLKKGEFLIFREIGIFILVCTTINVYPKHSTKQLLRYKLISVLPKKKLLLGK
jgi:hypothetical protein